MVGLIFCLELVCFFYCVSYFKFWGLFEECEDCWKYCLFFIVRNEEGSFSWFYVEDVILWRGLVLRVMVCVYVVICVIYVVIVVYCGIDLVIII